MNSGPGKIMHPIATSATFPRERSQPRLSTAPSVEIVRGDVRVIDELAAEWRALCEEGAVQEPFFRPEWIGTYLRTLEPAARIVLVTARRGKRLRVVLPLVEEHTMFYGVRVARLRAPTSQDSPDRIDLILGNGERATVIDAIWRRLRDTHGWDLLDLADIPEGGAMHDMVAHAERSGHPTACRVSRQTPYVPLPGPGGTFDQAIAHTSAKFRANIRRRMRNLEKIGEVRLVRLEEADPVFLERFFAMEAAGWKGERGSAIACDPHQRAYYAALAHEAARYGYLTLYTLECAGEPVAMHFGLTIGGRYMVPKLTYNETWHEFAPGHLLVYEVLRDCVARGLTEFDFLGVATPWKMEWTPVVRDFHHCYIFGRGVTGRSAHAVRFRLLPAGRRLTHELPLTCAHREQTR